jgi:hypothetical protein
MGAWRKPDERWQSAHDLTSELLDRGERQQTPWQHPVWTRSSIACDDATWDRGRVFF